MDALDVAILRHMGIRPYGPAPKDPDALNPAVIARALGTSHVTVRKRIRQMEDAGLVAGYQVYPNLRHLGFGASAFLVRIPDEVAKARALARIREWDGAIAVHDFMGPEACIDLAFERPDELRASLARIAEETGDQDAMAFCDRRMPAVERRLSNLDWRILRALRGRADRPLAEAAGELGVSARTVKRHFDRMIREGSVFVVPRVDLSRLEGLIPFFLAFTWDRPQGPETENAALKAFDDRRIHTCFPVDRRIGQMGVMLFARSMAEVDDARALALKLPHVARVRTWIYRAWEEHSGWIDAAIERRIRETQPGEALAEPSALRA